MKAEDENEKRQAIYYIAGIYSRCANTNEIYIETRFGNIAGRFAEIALKYLGISPEKILIKDFGNAKRASFYHSRYAKEFRRIADRETKIFTKKSDIAASYVAGMFDAAGRIEKGKLIIKGLSPSDQIMLSNLGIHANGNAIMNASDFIMFIKGYSLLLEHIRLPGNERDLR